MPIDESIVKASSAFAEMVVDAETRRKVHRGLDSEGKPILDGRDYLPLRSPDGSVWRVRVDNAGVLTATKET